jgi:glycosyltransferase involved in cell wall biosynthesis
MILFVAKEIGGNTGNPVANRDTLISLLLTNQQIGIIYFSKVEIPKSVNGKKIPVPILDISFQNWPPSEEKINFVITKLNYFEIKVIIVNDWAFHNLFKFRIISRLKHPLTLQTALITQTQPTNYRFPVSFEEVLKRTNEYNHFITVSQTVTNEWVDSGLKKNSSNIHCIPNCIDEERVEKFLKLSKRSIRDTMGLPKHKFISVCVATIQYRKNQNLITDCAEKLLRIFPEDIFYFIGMVVKELGGSEIAYKILNSKYRSNFKIIGEVDDALPYIRSADMLILPSLGEVLPISIIEAMALKTPVLASNVGGVPELIENNRNGYCFSPSSPTNFSESYLKLRKRKSLRDRFVNASFRRYKNHFSRTLHENGWSKLVNDLMKK